MADGSIVIETDLDNSGVESGLNQLKGIFVKGVAALGVGKMFSEAIKSGISFESAFTGVQKTVDATDEQLKTLRSNIRGMAKEMPESVEEIAGVAEAAGQLGIKTKSITSFTKTMVQLGDATNLSSESAATSLARFANITGMSQNHFDRLGSTVVALGNNLATTESEIVDMSMRIAGAGSQVNMTEAQIMSFSGALSSVGIEAEAGGTAFSTLLSKMNLAATKGGDSLKSFADVSGMSSSEFKEAFEKDAAGAVISFIQGLDKVNKSGGSAIKVLDDMKLSDVRMRDALLRAAGASAQFTQAVELGNQAWKDNTALAKEAETRYGTMESQLAMTKNKLKDIGISVYDDVSKPMAKGLASANKHLDKFMSKLEKGGIKSLVPDEVLNGVKNLGSIAKTVGGGGLKVLSKGIKGLADNLDVVIPLTTSILGAMAGYQVFNMASAGVTALSTAYGALNAMQVAGVLTATAQAGGLTVLQTAVGIFTGKISLATAATGTFNAACTALGGPVGVAVVAIGALVAGLGAYALTQDNSILNEETLREKMQKSSEAQEKYLESLKENKKAREESIETTRTEGKQADFLSMKLDDLMSVENKSAGQKEQIKTIVEKLNELLPDLGLAYDEEKDKLNKSTDAIKKNIAAQKELAMAKAYGAQMESITEDIIKTEDKLDKATKKQIKAAEELKAAEEDVKKARSDKSVAPKDNIDLQIALENQRQLNEAYDSANEQVIKYQQSLGELNAELETTGNRQIGETNYAEFLGGIDKICEEAKIKATDIPESVAQGMKDGLYANPMTGEELNALVNLDSLVQKAQADGVQVPAAVAQGIQNGKYVLPASVDQMKALIKLDEIQNMSLKSGVKIPNNLSKGIASGKSKPSNAIKQMEALIEFDEMITKSGTAGTEAVQKLVSAVNSGKMEPIEAVKQMNDLVAKESAQGLGEAADKGGKEYSEGLDSKKGAITKTGKGASTAAKKGAKSESFVPVGSFIGSGIESGLISKIPAIQSAARRAVKSAKDAAKSEADINSPSRVFRDEVGKFLPLGMAVGIEKYTGAVENASRGMAQASINATTDELDIHSPSKKFKEIVGKNIPKGIAAGVKAAKNELAAEMESAMSEVLSNVQSMAREGKYSQIGSDLMSGLSESLNTAKTRSSNNLQTSIDKQYEALAVAHEKAEKAKQDQIDKAKGKKNKKKRKKLKNQLSKLKAANKKEAAQLQEAGEKVANAFNTAFEKESDRLTQIAQKNIQELSEEYKKEYDRIAGLRDNLMNKQQSWGNVYDLKQNLYDIERYQKHLKALENKIPESMMEKILGMNVDEASAYMEWFQAMSADQQKAYIANWNKQQSMSEAFSNNFFADDFSKIESEYQTKLKKATDDLQKQIKQAGVNIAKGLAAGIKSETRSANKAIKDLCNKLIKTAKKQLGIKSPSRKFAEIGRYDVLGIEKGHEKEAKNLYRQMEDVSETMAQRFAKARLNIPELQGRMQSALQKQMGRITANVQTPKTSQNTTSDVTTERIVYMGPEKIEVVTVLEGREVARSTAPYMDQFLNDIVNRRLRGGT